MNRTEALDYLKEFKAILPTDWSLARLDAAIAALSSCGEPIAEGYADPDTLADYNAGRQHMMTVFKVQGLSTEKPVIILSASADSDKGRDDLVSS